MGGGAGRSGFTRKGSREARAIAGRLVALMYAPEDAGAALAAAEFCDAVGTQKRGREETRAVSSDLHKQYAHAHAHAHLHAPCVCALLHARLRSVVVPCPGWGGGMKHCGLAESVCGRS
ncbi:hypothetical protein OAO87_01090 [bacterium]|nr:hypothetical protein [bacterium]